MAKALASATGRRKESTAYVRLLPGSGSITVNGKPALEYLKRETLVMIVEEPFEVTETAGSYDVVAHTKGGGLSGQAGAVRLGLSRSLLQLNDAHRSGREELAFGFHMFLTSPFPPRRFPRCRGGRSQGPPD